MAETTVPCTERADYEVHSWCDLPHGHRGPHRSAGGVRWEHPGPVTWRKRAPAIVVREVPAPIIAILSLWLAVSHARSIPWWAFALWALGAFVWQRACDAAGVLRNPVLDPTGERRAASSP